MNTLLGTKINMDQLFVDMIRVPVTVVQVGPCVVTQIKTKDVDGYTAIQFGFGDKSLKNITKPLKGHLKGAITNNKAPRFLGEASLEEGDSYKVGDVITLSDVFAKGDTVTVTGTSKGKGFQGVVKRWGFSGGSRTHGHHGTGRSSGSIGQGTTPGRVWKGKKMGGRMGGDTITIPNLKVISVNVEKNKMSISGTIPGGPKGFLVIKRTKRGPVEEVAVDSDNQENK